MFRSSRIDIGFLAFLLFLVFVIYMITTPVKADEVKPEPPTVVQNYTLTVTSEEASLLFAIFSSAEMAQIKWQPLANKLGNQIGVQNDAARKAHDEWVTEQNKKNAPKK